MVDKMPKIWEVIIAVYRQKVAMSHPTMTTTWPVVNGHNITVGNYKDWVVVFFKNTASSGFMQINSGASFPEGVIGAPNITDENVEQVRTRLIRHFGARPNDAVFLLREMKDLERETSAIMRQHEHYMGLSPMKIFLSHKGKDKPIVREIKKTLELLGFDPWLDEDAMTAGADLERALLKGMQESCAAVFFITPNYKDENFLATEVSYAIAEKRKKDEKFSIITLKFADEAGAEGEIPEMLHRFVWKEPKGDLEALREILKALPIQTGSPYWKA